MIDYSITSKEGTKTLFQNIFLGDNRTCSVLLTQRHQNPEIIMKARTLVIRFPIQFFDHIGLWNSLLHMSKLYFYKKSCQLVHICCSLIYNSYIAVCSKLINS